MSERSTSELRPAPIKVSPVFGKVILLKGTVRNLLSVHKRLVRFSWCVCVCVCGGGGGHTVKRDYPESAGHLHY